MQPLIDADILVYEAAFAAQFKDEETGEYVAKPFDDAAEIFDERVRIICDSVWATERPLLFLTGNRSLLTIQNRWNKTHGIKPVDYLPNFREAVGISRPYKERRTQKPYHYRNLQAYCLANYETVVAWGMEADDLLAVFQSRRLATLDTVICSRDKDLRQVPGMQFSWEVGNQAGWGPTRVDETGTLNLVGGKKLVGTGWKFFYAQMVTGDPVDTIPGLPKAGPVLAFKTLESCSTELEMYEAVKALYQEKIGEGWQDYMKEQANLLYMVRELTDEGKPVLYKPPHLRG